MNCNSEFMQSRTLTEHLKRDSRQIKVTIEEKPCLPSKSREKVIFLHAPALTGKKRPISPFIPPVSSGVVIVSAQKKMNVIEQRTILLKRIHTEHIYEYQLLGENNRKWCITGRSKIVEKKTPGNDWDDGYVLLKKFMVSFYFFYFSFVFHNPSSTWAINCW